MHNAHKMMLNNDHFMGVLGCDEFLTINNSLTVF